MALQKSSQLIARSGSVLETFPNDYRGVSSSIGKSLQDLTSLESAVKMAQAAIKELNDHAPSERILTFTSKGGNTRQTSTIFQPPKKGEVYEPVISFATHARSFPFLGDAIVRASDGTVILVNFDLQIGLSLDGGYEPGIGFFHGATVVDEDFISSQKIQDDFKRALWHIEKMTGEDKLPDGYEFDYGAY